MKLLTPSSYRYEQVCSRAEKAVRSLRRSRRVAALVISSALGVSSLGSVSNAAPQALPSNYEAFPGFSNSNAHLLKLTAIDPTQSNLSYMVQKLPVQGVLYEITGTPVKVGVALKTSRVRYVPGPAASGSDNFQWIARDGSGATSSAATATINVVDWYAPAGIPQPTFGVTEVAPARPNPWTAAVANYYYVDQYNAAAIDTNNPYGTPAKPRKTIPTSLKAGAVVELHGKYDYALSGRILINGNGTAAAPIFLRGASLTDRPKLVGEVRPTGSYIILESLDMAGGKMNIVAPSHHVAVRHCSMHDKASTGISVGSWLEGQETANDVLIMDNDIHDMGKFNADGSFQQVGFDAHGVMCFTMSKNVWILDNQIYRVHGDSIQLSRAHGNETQGPAQNIYIGRNVMHHNGEGALDFKVPRNVVVSENFMYSFMPTDVSGVGGACSGAAVACHNNGQTATWPYPYRIWFFNNEITDCQFGLRWTSGDEMYAYGNVIYNMREISPNSPPEGSIYRFGTAIRVNGPRNVHLANNTITDSLQGIAVQVKSTTNAIIQNNVVADMKEADNYHITVEKVSGADAALAKCVMSHNLVWQTGGQTRLKWGTATYTLASLLSGSPGQAGVGRGSIEANPLFLNRKGQDLNVFTNSPVINKGTDPAIDTVFSPLYGENITEDFNLTDRPQGGAWDMGSYEMPN